MTTATATDTATALLPWQAQSWSQLQQLRERLPHALLFHGAEGTGKTLFVEAFAKSLLCEQPRADAHACGTCASCNWFSQYNHPDYRRVRPEVLEDELSEEEGADEKKSAKATRAPSKEIRIDQIRALADFMNVSTHRSGLRVVMLYPAEALNTAAANALLKTLEEPPPGTMFLLLSNRLDRLLPTILSRCRKFALPMPAREVAQGWLQAQGVKDAEAWLAEQGGAPLAALEAAQGESRELQEEWLRHLAQPGVDSALKAADKFQKVPVSQLVGWLQRWLYDLFSLASTGQVRYYPRHATLLGKLAGRTDALALSRALKGMGERRAIADHPLSAKLFIEEMLIDYGRLFD